MPEPKKRNRKNRLRNRLQSIFVTKKLNRSRKFIVSTIATETNRFLAGFSTVNFVKKQHKRFLWAIFNSCDYFYNPRNLVSFFFHNYTKFCVIMLILQPNRLSIKIWNRKLPKRFFGSGFPLNVTVLKSQYIPIFSLDCFFKNLYCI